MEERLAKVDLPVCTPIEKDALRPAAVPLFESAIVADAVGKIAVESNAGRESHVGRFISLEAATQTCNISMTGHQAGDAHDTQKCGGAKGQ